VTVTTEPSESADSPHAPVEIVELSGATTERSPVYVLTLVLAAALVAITIFFVKFDESALLGFENDLLAFLYKAPNAFERFLLGSSQFVALVFPIFLIGAFVATRRYFGLLVAAIAAGAGALAIWGLQEVLGRADIEKLTHPRGTWIFGSHFPNYAYLGAAAAVATVVGAYFGRRWGRVAWFFVAVVVFFRVLSGAELPVDLAMAIATGWALGSGALLAFGSPTHRATGQDIAVALAQSGFTVQHLAPASVDARGSTPWFATTDDGRLFVKALGRDERDADLLFRLFRYGRSRRCGARWNTKRSSH
jgi:hypothetical protein